MNSNGCPGIPDNPDITGLGLCLVFYIQGYITVILANLPASGADVSASYWAMTMTAVALFISALVLNGAQN